AARCAGSWPRSYKSDDRNRNRRPVDVVGERFLYTASINEICRRADAGRRSRRDPADGWQRRSTTAIHDRQTDTVRRYRKDQIQSFRDVLYLLLATHRPEP